MPDRNTAGGAPLHTGSTGIATLRFAIDQHRYGGPLPAACHMQHRSGWTLAGPDFLLQEHQSLHKSLRAGGATWDIHIHREKLVYPLNNTVHVIHAA